MPSTTSIVAARAPKRLVSSGEAKIVNDAPKTLVEIRVERLLVGAGYVA